MVLISKMTYEAIYQESRQLRIKNAIDDTWGRAHCYLHLGAVIEAGKLKKRKYPYELAAGKTIPVISLEGFSLALNVLGMIGGCTAMHDRGLELIYASAIDPGYDAGVLTLSIRNNKDTSENLKLKDRIGKVLFFDVSDAHLLFQEYKDVRVHEAQAKFSADLKKFAEERDDPF